MKPVLLLGDSCTDKFVYCRCVRLCPEAPVPLLDVDHVTSNYGMAGNVWQNLRGLGVKTQFFTNTNTDDIVKTRYVDSKTNHMFIRIDHTEPPSTTFKDYKKRIKWDKFSAVVISDYIKGFLTEDDIEHIAKKHSTTFLDTKRPLGSWCDNISYIKINRQEYANTKPSITPRLEENIIVTCGGEGATFRGRKYPVNDVEVKDVSGAGDTFLAGLVAAYVKGSSIHDAITYANSCASYVVQRKGVTVVTAGDVLHLCP